MNDTALIPVYRYGRLWDWAWIDAGYERLFSCLRWTLGGGPYAATPALGIMHRYILGLKRCDGLVGHHINEDTLDNRRSNLQVAESLVAHGALPHPRRDAVSARRGHLLPPHERIVYLTERTAA